jgi:hypothetical protein
MHRCLVLCATALACTAGSAQAQTDERAAGSARLTVTGFVGYGFAYDRDAVVHSFGTSQRHEVRVPASEVFGAAARYMVTPRLGIETALFYRGEVIELDDCDPDEEGICQGVFSRTHSPLLIARAAVTARMQRMPLFVAFGPALVRENDWPHYHPALSAGAGIDVPLPVTTRRVSFFAGIDSFQVFWREQSAPDAVVEAVGSRVTALRAGLSVGF